MVVNCGSASVKTALFDRENARLRGAAVAEWIKGANARARVTFPASEALNMDRDGDMSDALACMLEGFRARGWLEGPPSAIGHRVVHGGEHFQKSQLIDAQVLADIEACIPLAPLHNPANLRGIQTMQALFPRTAQVAVFDTAFHQSLRPETYLYAVPYGWYRDHQIRRYGFHGTSHRFILEESARRLGRAPQSVSLISAHLGNGCSITAIASGQSVDTSMGFTPLEGLVMGTRSGDLDPGLFSYLIGLGMSSDRINEALNHHSGLLGLSELSNDMRELERAEAAGHEGAKRAIDVFCFRLARYIGAMMASVPVLDALVFTGGIGENSALIRARTVAQLGQLGFSLDSGLNALHGAGSEGRISPPGSHRTLVIRTDEEAMIARDTIELTS